MTKPKIKVGLIGAGIISWAHEAGYDEVPDKAQIVTVCDIDEEKARSRAEAHQAKVTTDYREIIADPQVDLVDITLPHHLHYAITMAALQAKKHVLLEKPLAMTYQESVEICKKAAQAGVQFTVAENTRFVKAYIEAEKLLKANRLGDILSVRTFLPANESFRLSTPDFWGKKAINGGGAVIDSGPHTFYLLKWLFGGIRDLRAFTSQIYKFESEVEDNAEVHGHLVNGAEFSCGFSFTTEIPHNERVEIYGSTGSLIIDQLSDPVVKLFEGPADFDGTPLPDVPYAPGAWHYLSIVDEVVDFVNSIWEGRLPTIDPMDGCYAVKVIEKAYESAKENKPMTI